MFVERMIFHAKYGQIDPLIALVREFNTGVGGRHGLHVSRMYTDATGPMFTLNIESDYPDMEGYMAASRAESSLFSTQEFQDWFARVAAVTERGEKQLFNMESFS